jgi:predicted transcriptional regulator
MRAQEFVGMVDGTIEKTSLTDKMKGMVETCRNCSPLSMVDCIEGCGIWKLKNELRLIYERMQRPSFVMFLFNVLKNERRLQVLEAISKGTASVKRLQQELNLLGHHYSQETIVEEYVVPLIEAGLVTQDEDKYTATVFGRRLNELTKSSCSIIGALPCHSECYEEAALSLLQNEPKTREAFESVIPAGNVGRILSRLSSARLVEKPKENDHVFFFKSRRSPDKEDLSPTEKRVYENILEEGIPARELALKTKISLRRTYKYLRRLKGKKMIFTREKPRSYALTAKGMQAATMLQSIRELTKEISETAAFVLNDSQNDELIVTAS